MEKGLLMAALGMSGVGALAWCWRTLNRPPLDIPLETATPVGPDGAPSGPPTKLDEQIITMRIVSQLWAKDQIKQIRFSEIARYWRDVKVEEKQARVIEFANKDIERFFETKIKGKPFFTGYTLDAVLDILELLDAEGNAPSVVNLNPDEPEKMLDGTTYDGLRRIPLYLHSIHVAEEAIDRSGGGAATPKAVIAALSHDLGKLPSHYGHFYQSATHGLGGVAVVESLQSVKRLKYFEEITNAVRNHHSQSDAHLDALVRESDQAARRKEIGDIGKLLVEPQQDEGACPPQTPPEIEAKAAAEENAAATQPDAPAVREEKKTDDVPEAKVQQAVNLVGKDDKQRVPRKVVDISGWFDADATMNALFGIINTALPPERFWSALSLDGYVYFKPKPFWDTIGRAAGWPAELRAASTSEQNRDDIIYSVVMELAKRPNTIASEFLGDGFFGTVFLHHTAKEGGKTSQLYLIPFKGEAFGDGLAEAERRKNAMALNTKSLEMKGNRKGSLV